MDKENSAAALKGRIRAGRVTKRDVARALAELAFGRANDCARLAMEPEAQVEKLDLRLLSEYKRSDKGAVEVKLVDRLKALEQLAQMAEAENTDLEAFLQALQTREGEE